MLENYFKEAAVLRRHREGLLGPYLDSFVSLAGDLGYPRSTVRYQCQVIHGFGRWLEQNRLRVVDIDDALVQRFLKEREGSNLVRSGGGACVLRLVDLLREMSVIASPQPTGEDSPLEEIVGRYSKYLRGERAVVQATVDNYVPFVRIFLEQRFGAGTLCFRDLGESDVTDFVLRWIHSQRSPGRSKLLVTALRSFFRFLLGHGEINLDLAAIVPTVADWRLSTIPKYLHPEEVERVLETCDRATAKGRRDYAILLLLARLGLRAGEVIRLELDDIDWRAGELTVCGKRFVHDRLPLPLEVGEALAVYLRQDRPRCSTRRVFIRCKAPYRELAHASTICTIVRAALERAGLDPPVKGAHLLRHSLATGMLRAGASMAEIGQVLRHRSPLTTEIYAKVDFEALRNLALPWPIEGGGR